jgi:hypothetical protein
MAELEVPAHIAEELRREQAALRSEAPDTDESTEDTPTPTVGAVFLIYLDQMGHWQADSDMAKAPSLIPARPVTLNDFYHAACDIKKDLNAMEAANRTVMVQMQQAAAMQAQMENARIAAAVSGGAGMPPGFPGSNGRR